MVLVFEIKCNPSAPVVEEGLEPPLRVTEMKGNKIGRTD